MVTNEKVEKVHIDITCFRPGEEPVTQKIDSPWAIISYGKGGLDQIFASGIGFTRMAGILSELISVKPKGLQITPIDKIKADFSISIAGRDAPQNQTIEAEYALIIYDDCFEPQIYYAGMDLYTAIGTLQFVHMQTVVGNTLKAMMTGLARPMPGGAMPPMGAPLNPRKLHIGP